MSTTTAEDCDRCGAFPAPHELHYHEGTPYEHSLWLCERCAICHGYESNGQAYAALKTIGFAISLLRGEGVTDEKITAAVHDILTSPHSDAEYPVGGDRIALGDERIEDDPWTRLFVSKGKVT